MNGVNGIISIENKKWYYMLIFASPTLSFYWHFHKKQINVKYYTNDTYTVNFTNVNPTLVKYLVKIENIYR